MKILLYVFALILSAGALTGCTKCGKDQVPPAPQMDEMEMQEYPEDVYGDDEFMMEEGDVGFPDDLENLDEDGYYDDDM